MYKIYLPRSLFPGLNIHIIVMIQDRIQLNHYSKNIVLQKWLVSLFCNPSFNHIDDISFSILLYHSLRCYAVKWQTRLRKNTNDKILQISIYSDGCRASYRTASEITKCMTSCFERIMTIIIQ